MTKEEAFMFLAKTGKLKTKKTTEIKTSPFSIGMETLDRDMFEAEPTFKHLAVLGAKWARIQPGWMKCEKTEGVYDFKWLDKVVTGLLEAGVQPWMNLGYGNKIYIPECDHPFGTGWCPLYSERARAGWCNFIDALTKHYRGRVSRFEIWNEPDGAKYYWQPLRKPDPAGVAELTKLTAKVIKKNVPDAFIIGGVVANPRNLKFIQGLFEGGIGEVINALSVHCYSTEPESSDGMLYDTIRGIIRRYNPDVKVWQGEGGAQSTPYGYGACWDLPWTEELQARIVAKRFVCDIGNRIELTNYFHLSDLKNYAGRGVPDYREYCYFGLLRRGDYSPKPSFRTMQTLATIFADGVELTDLAIADLYDDASGRYVFGCRKIFRKGNYPVIACWTPANVFDQTPPRRVDIAYNVLSAGMTLDNPVLIDPITQDVYFVPPARPEGCTLKDPCAEPNMLHRIPYMDYPLIITDRAAIEIIEEK